MCEIRLSIFDVYKCELKKKKRKFKPMSWCTRMPTYAISLNVIRLFLMFTSVKIYSTFECTSNDRPK